MAVNSSRSMIDDLLTGMNEGTYIVLHPGWTDNMREPRVERLAWPTYRQALARVPRLNLASSVPPQDDSIFTEPRHRPALG